MNSAFMHPHFLWLFLVIPIAMFWQYKITKRQQPAIKISSTAGLSIKKSWIIKCRPFLFWLKIMALGFVIIALARPRNTQKSSFTATRNGIDIVIAMDVSLSMFARDFEPNRLEASKMVAKEFIEGRKGDRIGLVVFAGEAFTACPTTLDYTILKDQIDKVTGEDLEQGTAIGTGLGTAVSRLRNDSLPSKVIILLTD